MQGGTAIDAAGQDVTVARAILGGAVRLRQSQHPMASLAARRVEAIMRELLMEVAPDEFLGPWDDESAADERVELAPDDTDRPTSS